VTGSISDKSDALTPLDVFILKQFIKDDKQTVEKMLGSKKAKVNGYAFLVVGEGIEKAQQVH
jgi:translation elongation factor EF-Ts